MLPAAAPARHGLPTSAFAIGHTFDSLPSDPFENRLRLWIAWCTTEVAAGCHPAFGLSYLRL